MVHTDEPYNRKRKWGVDMHKERRDLVLIMEDETVPPSNHRTGKGSVREAITRDKEGRTRREEPDEDEVEDCHVIAQIKEEVVPGPFLVYIGAQRQKVTTLQRIRNVYPPEIQSPPSQHWI